MPKPNAEPACGSPPPASPPPPAEHDVLEDKRPGGRIFKAVQAASLFLVVGAVMLIFVGFVLGVPIPGLHHAPEEMDIKPPPSLGVRLADGVAHTLVIPEEVRLALGIRKGGRDLIEVVRVPTKTRPLTMYGSTALDPTRLMRIRARFAPAEVVSIGTVNELRGGRTETRELRPGDRVKRGDILGVFFSVDVGSKKNDLLDSLVQLLLDQKILDRCEKGLGSIPEMFVLSQVRAVQTDRNAVTRALNNLKVWNIPQEEIDALHDEAKRIAADKNAWYKTPTGRWVMKGEKAVATKATTLPNTPDRGPVARIDPDAENNNPWGRVTLRAPFDGIIVERNIVPHEIVQDPTINLFQIAQVHRLLVVANAPEDELPNLHALDFPQRRWTVETVGLTAGTRLEGPIDEVGFLIDPNQHTAIIKGYIDNPKEVIRAGQFITATVQIPPPNDVVEIPLEAVVEDGQSCVVLVQADARKHHYAMRRVLLTHRFEKTAFVRSKPFTKEEQKLTAEEKEQGLQALQPLRPGERLLKTGVGELKAALLDLESRPKSQRTESAKSKRVAGEEGT
jgi:cobalt-zinc-cadmium efflux system membrane fusion protein